jgi:hypothetical protein
LNLKVGNDERSWTFVVRPPTEESDLRAYAPSRLAQVRAGLNMSVLEVSADELSAAVGKGRAGRELWLPLVIAALVLLGVETWFARWCSAAGPT